MAGGIFDNKLFDRNIFDVWDEVVASVSVSQADNTVSANGVITVVPGIFDSDTFDSGIFDTPSQDVFGVVNLTQADNTSAATGQVAVVAASSVAQAGDALSASAGLHVTASLTAAQAGDVISVTGSVTEPDVVITASLVQASQTAQAAGAVLISGEAAYTQNSDVLFADAEIIVGGQATATQAGDSAASSGDAYFLTIGTVSLQQGANGVFSAGEVPAAASALLSQVSNGIVSSGLITGWGRPDPIGDENWQEFVPGTPSWVPVSGASGSWTPINAGAP